jgi:hypothetical protein
MESDDPADQARGEFARVQLALEDESLFPAERERLRLREQELLDLHQREWLGELAPFLLGPPVVTGLVFEPLARATFRRGWLDQLDIDILQLDFARALARAPETRFLRQLGIGGGEPRSRNFIPRPDDHVPPDEHSVGMCPLVGSLYLGNVRVFRFGHNPGDDWREHSGRARSGVLDDILRLMPKLEELYVFGEGLPSRILFRMSLPRLRVVMMYQTSQVLRLDFLADNPSYSSLTTLRFHPHHIERFSEEDFIGCFLQEEGYLPLRVVRPLLHSPHLQKLKHLQLRLSSIGDEGCQEIVASGILKRLKALDLRHGRITSAGARLLAECPDVRHLEWLDLDRNQLRAAGRRRLERLDIPHLAVSDQMSVGDIADQRYLCEGDFE